MTTKKRTTEQIRAAELRVNPEVQRRTDPKHAGRIADAFDPAGLGVLEVSKHADGSYWVMDGAHRLAAVLMRGEGDRRMACNVHHGLTIAEEAKIFGLRNTFKQPQYIDRFRIRVKSGERDASEVQRIVENAGWKIDWAPLDGHIQAVKACDDIYLGKIFRKGQPSADGVYPDALAWVLNIVSAAWGYQNSATHANILVALGKVWFRDHAVIDPARLAKKLAPYPGGPDGLRGAGHGVKAVFGGTVTDGIAGVIVETYNKSLRSGALEPWRVSR